MYKTLSLFSVVMLAGCFSDPTPTLYFEDCGQGCSDKDWVFAAGGAHSTAKTTSGTFTDVRSSDPSILRAVIKDPGTAHLGGLDDVDLFTGNPGNVTLTVVGDKGVTVTVEAQVVATDRLELVGFATSGGSAVPSTIVEAEPQIFHVRTQTNGETTRGDGAVQFALSGSLSDAYVPLDGDAIAVVGAVGSGTIVASCSDVSVQQDVTIIPSSAVTSLDASVSAAAPNGTVVVLVGAKAGGEAVLAGNCAWSGMAPSVTLTSQAPPSFGLPGDVSTFTLTRPGSFDVTCAMGGQSTTVTLAR